MKLADGEIIGRREVRVICTKGFVFEPYDNGKRVEEGSVFELVDDPCNFKSDCDSFVLVSREETKLKWMYITKQALEKHFELLA